MPQHTAKARAERRSSRRIALAITSLLLCVHSSRVEADEESILTDSSVIGQNFGYPSGDPLFPSSDSPVGAIELGVEGLFFFKNLELTDLDQNGIDGETFVGFLAPLRLRYRVHEKVFIEAGAVVGQNYGDEDELDIAEPLARLVLEPVEKFFIIGGTLIPTHAIHDALLDDIQIFRIGAEQGFQARTDWERYRSDTWLNWRVRETDTDPEEFEVGHVSKLLFGGAELDGQVLWAHVGGQQNASDRVENNLQILLGGSFGIALSDLIADLRAHAHYLHSFDESRVTDDIHGDGIEVRVSADLVPIPELLVRLHASYFRGDDIIPRRGDPLYSLDEYSQLGIHTVWTFAAGVRVEGGLVGQVGDGELVSTYFLNFVWGRNFHVFTYDPTRRAPEANTTP